MRGKLATPPMASRQKEPVPPPGEHDAQAPQRGPGLFRGRVLPLGRIFGIQVGIDSSWILVLGFVAVLVASGLYETHSTWGAGLTFLLGVLASLGFFASILLHELGHVVVAHGLGVPVVSVTLHLFGGIAQHASEPRRARDSFLVAAAGPLVSLILLLACVLLERSIPGSGQGSDALRQLLLHVATINFLVFGLNLLPGLPLDGGFALRALVWGATGDAERGTRVARASGALSALFLIGAGVSVIVGFRWLNGLWLVVFGWLMLRAARNSGLQLVIRNLLDRIHVRDVMLSRVETDRWNTVADLQDVLREARGPVFVHGEAGLLGWLTPDQVLAIPARKRPYIQVSSALVPLADIARIAAERTLLDALNLMNARGTRELAVSDGGEIVGALTRQGLLDALRERGGAGPARA